jgi:signal transduction histidine kinase
MLAEELETSVASRRELEEANARLFEAGRMAALGLLAAGVAHEVNNPAAWISLSLGMVRRSHASIRRKVEEDPEPGNSALLAELDAVDQLVSDCVEGIARITAVVTDLRALSRADDDSFEPIAFDEVIASCCRLASHRLGKIRVVVEVRPTPVVIANRGRIAQVVTNLLVNAAQAIAESKDDGGEIAISTAEADGGALLSVEDSGVGIAELLRERVFEPFFTTKNAADGMGLGLTIVAKIAQSYGGWARVGAARGRRGAQVEVWFPSRAEVTSVSR